MVAPVGRECEHCETSRLCVRAASGDVVPSRHDVQSVRTPGDNSVNLAHFVAPTLATSTLAGPILAVWGSADLLHAAAQHHPITDPASSVAWWIADRHEPTTEEGFRRLAFLHEHGPSPHAFSPWQSMSRLEIDRVWLDDTDVQLLIAQLNADLYQRYPEPGALVFSLHPADIVDGVGALLLAQLDGRPVGCGAFRVFDDQPGSAEIKRMYVAPSARGRKIGAALLAELELRAARLGVRVVSLETGPRQLEALQRFARAGYTACEPWGPFVGKSFSICLAKTLPEDFV